jgi:hypothetical protein
VYDGVGDGDSVSGFRVDLSVVERDTDTVEVDGREDAGGWR